MPVEVYFSLGSNLGDRAANLETALGMMDSFFSRHYDRLSGFVETAPWGFDSDDMFLNCAVCYTLDMDCLSVLDICKKIEVMMGRSVHCPEFDSTGRRIYRSRIIDIDILFYGDREIATARLTVPHPLMAERDFVMVPLREIASEDIMDSFPGIFSGTSSASRV